VLWLQKLLYFTLLLLDHLFVDSEENDFTYKQYKSHDETESPKLEHSNEVLNGELTRSITASIDFPKLFIRISAFHEVRDAKVLEAVDPLVDFINQVEVLPEVDDDVVGHERLLAGLVGEFFEVNLVTVERVAHVLENDALESRIESFLAVVFDLGELDDLSP
jgi:hypothetical protein